MGEVAVARVAPSGGEDEVDHGGRRGVGRAGRDISTWRWNSESDSGSGSDAGGGSDSGSVIQQAVHRPPRIREYQSLLPNSQTPPALPPLFIYFIISTAPPISGTFPARTSLTPRHLHTAREAPVATHLSPRPPCRPRCSSLSSSGACSSRSARSIYAPSFCTDRLQGSSNSLWSKWQVRHARHAYLMDS